MVIFSVAAQKFLKDLENRSKISKGYTSERTLDTYGRVLGKFTGHINKGNAESLDLTKITGDEITSFLVEARDEGASDATINLYHSCLSSFYEFCEKNYKNITNIMRFVDRARNIREESKCFTKDEINSLLDYLKKDNKAQKRDYLLFELMIRTGARVSEVSFLNLDSIKTTPISINIRFKGKGNKFRSVEIPLFGVSGSEIKVHTGFKRRIEHYLSDDRRKWKVNSGHENAFFLSNLGNRLSINTLQCTFRYYMKKLNLKGFSPHSFRHYFITNMISQGVDIPTVSKIVGHANPQVTMAIYAHSDEEKMKKAMEKAFQVAAPKMR